MIVGEYEHEPVRGLPENLPAGERLLWRGEPRWSGLARRVFHLHTLALYFAALVGLHLGSQLMDGQSLTSALLAVSWQLCLGLTALAILSLLALAYARTTVYTLTDRRLVLRFGVAVPMMINLPLERVQSAGLRRGRDGSGDIALELAPGQRMSWWMLWPNARPWHFSRVQPMLRALVQPERVAELLARAATGETARLPAADSAPAESTPLPAGGGAVTAT